MNDTTIKLGKVKNLDGSVSLLVERGNESISIPTRFNDDSQVDTMSYLVQNLIAPFVTDNLEIYNSPEDQKFEPIAGEKKRRWVVSYVHFQDNDLRSEIVIAANWMEALIHSSFELKWIFEEESYGEGERPPAKLCDAQRLAFNADQLINAIEV